MRRVRSWYEPVETSRIFLFCTFIMLNFFIHKRFFNFSLRVKYFKLVWVELVKQGFFFWSSCSSLRNLELDLLYWVYNWEMNCYQWSLKAGKWSHFVFVNSKHALFCNTAISFDVYLVYSGFVFVKDTFIHYLVIWIA